MQGAYLGPRFDDAAIRRDLDQAGGVYELVDDDQLFPLIARLIEEGNVVGWFQGRMEFGPRALGARSIIGDPRNQEMQTTMNLKIKYRESFRPFAPSVLAEDVAAWFEFDTASPYMLMVAQVHEEHRFPTTPEQQMLFGIEKLKVPRSTIQAITHVDYSARLQTVHRDTNPRYWRLINTFKGLTGCPLVVNTSFNVRGEPIVCSPADAYRCFMRTEIDYLVIENYLLAKTAQPKRQLDDSWKQEFELD
jgi:carbamoyltransferase